MILHLLSIVPWYVWLLAAAAAVAVVYLRFGKNPAAVLGALSAALIAYLAGRKAERQGAQQQEQHHADQIQNRAEDARATAERIPDDKLREPSPFQRD